MKDQIRKFLEVIRKNTHFVILYHKNADGDCLANALLWSYFLSQRKKQYRIVASDPFPDRYEFLLERYSRITDDRVLIVPDKKSLDRSLPSQFKKAVILILDSSNLERVGRERQELEQYSAILNVDHHADNSMFGDVNCVDKKASASGQISYEILCAAKYKFDKVASELLYISLYADTGGFSQKNTNKKTLQILSELIQMSADIVSLNGVLKMRSYARTLLLGRLLSRVKHVNRKLFWTHVTTADLRELNLAQYDTDGIVEEMTAITGSEVVALFKEVSPQLVRVSLRSRSEFNVKPLANKYKGGGHEKAAGCELAGSLDAVMNKMVNELSYLMGLK
jgi:phosphoesterase RecJ-like protein